MHSTRGTLLAWMWLLLVAAFGAHLLWIHGRGELVIDTDVLSLLPQASRDAGVDAALARLGGQASRRLVVALAGSERARVRELAQQVHASLGSEHGPLRALDDAAVDLEQLTAFYAPHRQRLLDADTRERLRAQAPADSARAALQRLLRPMPGPQLLRPLDDPLGSYSDWLASRAASTRLRPDQGWLALQDGDAYLLVLAYELRADSLSVAALQQLQPLLRSNAQLATAAGIEWLSAGVPVHAAAAAEQAAWEMRTIGLGAAAGIALLTLLCLRSLRPLLLVLLTVAVGLLVALSLSLMVFGRIHLITLVFGASLIGVAQDYAIHVLCARASDGGADAAHRLRPALWLALASSALGYAALALAPFPGLRQMALFSVVGLLAALISVLLWFPLLLGERVQLRRFGAWLGASRRWLKPPSTGLGRNLPLAVLLALILGGLWQLRAHDDLRALQSSPQSLIDQQLRLGTLLGEPSPVQFYLLRADDPETLLRREEALVERLRALGRSGQIDGHRAVSDWLPSQARQRADQQLLAPALAAAAQLLEQQLGSSSQEPEPLAPMLLTPEQWLASPLSWPWRALWLGQIDGQYASVVQLAGLTRPQQIPPLQALADASAGVLWVDRTADYSRVLRDYRLAMSAVLLLGLSLVAALLWLRFASRAWRVLTPVMIALLLVLAVQGWRGEPLHLFHVLGLAVLLGMSVDYGIFLLQPHSGDAAWLAVTLGAFNTLLAFGLLAFSATPALAAFGSTLLIGIACAWLLAPLLCTPTTTDEAIAL